MKVFAEVQRLSIRFRAELLLERDTTHVHRHVLQMVGAGGDYLAYLLISGGYGGVLSYEVVPDDGEERLVVFGFEVAATVAQQRTHPFLLSLPQQGVGPLTHSGAS
jgi:hypothetical protein